MKVEFIKKDNNTLTVQIEVNENTFIHKDITKEEAITIKNQLQVLLTNFRK